MEGKFSMDSQILEEVIRSGNIPCHGRTGMLCAGGGLLPPALLDESRVPKFYLDAIVACGGTTSSALPNTGLVYNLMGTSGLPKDVLSHIWSAVNRAKPGQLTRPEFFSLLALIALAQKGESLAALCAMDSLPLPYLNPVQAFPTVANPAPTTNTSSSFVPFAKIKPSAFIPTSLLPRRSVRKKKEPDSKEASAHNSPAKGAAHDLAGLDFSDTPKDEREEKDSNETPMQTCWRETVHAIYIVVEEANQILKEVRKDVLQEIADTEKGAAYFGSLAKAFDTLERVSKSAGVLLSNQSTKEAEYCRNLRRKWEPYLGTKAEANGESTDDRKCAICCQPVRNAIDYGGQCYDVTCANLWVNGVSSTLPSLHLK